MTSYDDLIDFAILPQSRVQNYENKIDEQTSTIENLSKKVTQLENSKSDAESKNEQEDSSLVDQTPSAKPIVEDASETAENPDSKAPPPPIPVDRKEELEASSSKLVKGRNYNRLCQARQLKEQLDDVNYAAPDNVDSLLTAAVGTSKKPIPNEEEFYKAIVSHNLISLIRNPNKFKKYIRPTFFKI